MIHYLRHTLKNFKIDGKKGGKKLQQSTHLVIIFLDICRLIPRLKKKIYFRRCSSACIYRQQKKNHKLFLLLFLKILISVLRKKKLTN